MFLIAIKTSLSLKKLSISTRLHLICTNILVFTKDNALMAYQIAFDMYDSATQQFLLRVQNALRSTVPLPEVESKKSADEKEDSNTDEGKEKWVLLLLLKIEWERELKQFKLTSLIIRVIKSEDIFRVYLFRYVESEGENKL